MKVTIDLAALIPSELEGLLRTFWDSDAVANFEYQAMKKIYASICGDEELAQLMKEIEEQS